MSYSYVSENSSDQQHYIHLMPESPLQHNSPTTSHVSSDMSPNTQLEHEKRVRREIANSNERRRMQSINTGFQSLKILIPHSCGEKLSKACILQRAADHIKTLENEKLKLQSQNEQFRILIKSFQIDSTSLLQGQRHLSTNNSDETVLLLGNTNETKPIFDDNNDDDDNNNIKNRHTYWHAQPIEKYYRNIKQQSIPTTTPSTTSSSDKTYMIVKQSQPSQRYYKTNSLDQNNDNNNEIVIVERCQLRTQSVDTNNTVSKRNLQTIVEAIRHLEGDDMLANINQTSSSSSSHHQQEDLPAQIKAMINEKFQQNNNKNSSSHDIDLHQKPPKKRKITYNESDETIIVQKQDLPPISSPEVHHHEQILNESSPPSSPVARLLQEHIRQHTLHCPPH